MKIRFATILSGLFAIMLSFVSALSGAQIMNNEPTLNAKQTAIIPIAAFTAKGDLTQLKTALNVGLDAGLTVNEINEILVQLYAYTGFPRSLNGINTFIAVYDERQAKGIKDEMGPAAEPLPSDKSRLQLGSEIQTQLVGQAVSGRTFEFSPAIDQFLKEHLFADIFARGVLDYQARELSTVAALACLPGAESQLRSHINISMNVGLTVPQIQAFVDILADKVGQEESQRAAKELAVVLEPK